MSGRRRKYCHPRCRQQSAVASARQKRQSVVGIRTRKCEGCDAVFVQSGRERNRRKWCSETCRVANWKSVHPEYEAHRKELEWARRQAFMAKRGPLRYDLTCAICAEDFVAGRPDCKFCTNTCRYRAAYIGRRARKVGAPRERYTPREIAERDNWTCGICSEPIDASLAYPAPLSLSIDHIVPLSRGGSDTRANVQAAHLDCNIRKGPHGPRITT